MSKRKAFACFGVAFVFAVIFTSSLCAQPATSLGTMGSVTILPNGGACPSGFGFYVGPPSKMTCYSAVLTDCPNTVALPLTFGYAPVPAGTTVQGTIVFLAADGGTQATTGPANAFAADYLVKGYGVVQIAWSSDWEDAGAIQGGSFTNNVINAACRPATFLNYVRYGLLPDGNSIYTKGGMCAQGVSGGSGAIAYPLVYYNAGSYLDKVEMESGPPNGNINIGCQVPVVQPYPSICPSGQTGCYGWPRNGTQVYPAYVGSEEDLTISTETGTGTDPLYGVPTCHDMKRSNTTQSWQAAWDSQSIAPQHKPTGNYYFPNTSIQAWLCHTTGGQKDLNNSGVLANYFYQAVGNVAGQRSYSVTAIDACNGPEGVDLGAAKVAIGGATRSPYAGTPGFNAIDIDMVGPNSLTVACTNLH